MIKITVPIKYNIARAEWTAIRAQLLVLGCPSTAVPKRYATLKHRLALIYTNAQPAWSNSYRDVILTGHLGSLVRWMADNKLRISHLTTPSRYVITAEGVSDA